MVECFTFIFVLAITFLLARWMETPSMAYGKPFYGIGPKKGSPPIEMFIAFREELDRVL